MTKDYKLKIGDELLISKIFRYNKEYILDKELKGFVISDGEDGQPFIYIINYNDIPKEYNYNYIGSYLDVFNDNKLLSKEKAIVLRNRNKELLKEEVNIFNSIFRTHIKPDLDKVVILNINQDEFKIINI